MSGKANASKKNSQQLKRNPKRKRIMRKCLIHLKDLSSEGQTKHTSLKQVKIASNKRKTWQPLSKSSRDHFQTMIESVIITILSNNLTDVSSLLNAERARDKANGEPLALLQETDKMVETTELMTGNIQSIKNKIQILASKVEEEKEKVKQMYQINSGILHVLELSEKTLKAPTLQKEILALISNQKLLLKDLDILHNSSQTKNMLTFIEEAYKKLSAS
uniref:Centromere protein Q n=1 Tax=Aotus nancymaae TaxID=37293 RepID=A0A2K5ETZ3_AOTNA